MMLELTLTLFAMIIILELIIRELEEPVDATIRYLFYLILLSINFVGILLSQNWLFAIILTIVEIALILIFILYAINKAKEIIVKW